MLTRFDPFAEMNRFQHELARGLFENQRTFMPAVDIVEEKDAILVTAELPGVKPEDVKVDVENNVLTLSGTRKTELDEKKDNVHRSERWRGSFQRQFMLPRTVDSEQIEASLKDGVLTLRLPKRNEVKPRQIAVRS